MAHADITDYDDGTSMAMISPEKYTYGDVFVHYDSEHRLIAVHIWSEKKKYWINIDGDKLVVEERDMEGKLLGV